VSAEKARSGGSRPHEGPERRARHGTLRLPAPRSERSRRCPRATTARGAGMVQSPSAQRDRAAVHSWRGLTGPPHFDAKIAGGFLGFAGERAELPGLSKVDSHITTQQAQLIGITMNTAAKLSAFIDDASRRHAAATMASKNDPIGADSEHSRSLRLHTAGMNAACGQAPLSTLASYRQANGCGKPLFSSSEIGRARAHGTIRRPAMPLAGLARLPAKPGRPRHTEGGNTPSTSPDLVTIPPHDVWIAEIRRTARHDGRPTHHVWPRRTRPAAQKPPSHGA